MLKTWIWLNFKRPRCKVWHLKLIIKLLLLSSNIMLKYKVIIEWHVFYNCRVHCISLRVLNISLRIGTVPTVGNIKVSLQTIRWPLVLFSESCMKTFDELLKVFKIRFEFIQWFLNARTAGRICAVCCCNQHSKEEESQHHDFEHFHQNAHDAGSAILLSTIKLCSTVYAHVSIPGFILSDAVVWRSCVMRRPSCALACRIQRSITEHV